jgi:DNA-binding PadR family transcriptional regulator
MAALLEERRRRMITTGLLKVLSVNGACFGREIANLYPTKIAYGTLYIALTRLQKSGWISKKIDKDDARYKTYAITKKGRRFLERKLKVMQAIVDMKKNSA